MKSLQLCHLKLPFAGIHLTSTTQESILLVLTLVWYRESHMCINTCLQSGSFFLVTVYWWQYIWECCFLLSLLKLWLIYLSHLFTFGPDGAIGILLSLHCHFYIIVLPSFLKYPPALKSVLLKYAVCCPPGFGHLTSGAGPLIPWRFLVTGSLTLLSASTSVMILDHLNSHIDGTFSILVFQFFDLLSFNSLSSIIT